VLDRFPDVSMRREVQYRGELMKTENLIETIPIKNIASGQRSPSYGPIVTRQEVIVGNRIQAARRKRLTGVRADIARATRHEDVRHDAASGVGRHKP
jgi:hypothetical protein